MINLVLAAMLQISSAEPVQPVDANSQASGPVVNETKDFADTSVSLEIKLVLDETISTKTHVKGDTFSLRTAEDYIVKDVQMPKGTEIIGQISRAQEKGAFGISGKLEARMLYAILPGRYLRIEGTLAAQGREDVAAKVAGMGGGLFFITGRSAKIEKGAAVIGRIGEKQEEN